MRRVRLAALALALALGAGTRSAHAELPRACATPPTLSAAEQDRLLRFSDVVKQELSRTPHDIALIARAGTDLARFGLRYSHAGFSLREGGQGAWSVRQLYYACDEDRPRLFDQGLPGFVFGGDDAALGHLSVLLLPQAESAALLRAVADPRQALQLLGTQYSANAHAFGLRYQNCNQWVAEVLALAWGGLPPGAGARARAQQWLRDEAYEPTQFQVDNPLLWLAAAFVPWLRQDDHPSEDLARRRLQVSMPASIEAFVRARVPGVRRLEFCHDTRQMVVREGWHPIDEGCRPGPQDRVIPLGSDHPTTPQ